MQAMAWHGMAWRGVEVSCILIFLSDAGSVSCVVRGQLRSAPLSPVYYVPFRRIDDKSTTIGRQIAPKEQEKNRKYVQKRMCNFVQM